MNRSASNIPQQTQTQTQPQQQQQQQHPQYSTQQGYPQYYQQPPQQPQQPQQPQPQQPQQPPPPTHSYQQQKVYSQTLVAPNKSRIQQQHVNTCLDYERIDNTSQDILEQSILQNDPKLNAYAILQVSSLCRQTAIRIAYKKLWNIFNTDKYSEKNKNIFDKVKEAYEFIKDEESRKLYNTNIGIKHNFRCPSCEKVGHVHANHSFIETKSKINCIYCNEIIVCYHCDKCGSGYIIEEKDVDIPGSFPVQCVICKNICECKILGIVSPPSPPQKQPPQKQPPQKQPPTPHPQQQQQPQQPPQKQPPTQQPPSSQYRQPTLSTPTNKTNLNSSGNSFPPINFNGYSIINGEPAHDGETLKATILRHTQEMHLIGKYMIKLSGMAKNFPNSDVRDKYNCLSTVINYVEAKQLQQEKGYHHVDDQYIKFKQEVDDFIRNIYCVCKHVVDNVPQPKFNNAFIMIGRLFKSLLHEATTTNIHVIEKYKGKLDQQLKFIQDVQTYTDLQIPQLNIYKTSLRTFLEIVKQYTGYSYNDSAEIKEMERYKENLLLNCSNIKQLIKDIKAIVLKYQYQILNPTIQITPGKGRKKLIMNNMIELSKNKHQKIVQKKHPQAQTGFGQPPKFAAKAMKNSGGPPTPDFAKDPEVLLKEIEARVKERVHEAWKQFNMIASRKQFVQPYKGPILLLEWKAQKSPSSRKSKRSKKVERQKRRLEKFNKREEKVIKLKKKQNSSKKRKLKPISISSDEDEDSHSDLESEDDYELNSRIKRHKSNNNNSNNNNNNITTSSVGRKQQQQKPKKRRSTNEKFIFNPETDSPPSSDNEEVFTVERILNRVTTNGKVQYLVKWEGYSSEQSTWVDAKNCYCIDLIDKYEAEREKRERERKNKIK